jgi:cell division protein FtsZ
MIEFSKDLQHTIATSMVKIIGIGGAGSNMIDRIAFDGQDDGEVLALNANVRTLSGSIAREKIQLGLNLTKGLGTGGDPELGQKVMLEAESEIRSSIKGRKIIFICVGLGGGTGSGGAPILTRIAREEGAFVVVFATMPFAFEGRRRCDQAEFSLNELSVLSNALIVFDNNRMGELVLAKQGIHEAFLAADRMIADSIKAVIRLVSKPGLIHVGLDDLVTALRSNRSRCLFGSGAATGQDRADKALLNALSSPLLDKGVLLKETSAILVHICGGEDLTLYEVELLMNKLIKYLPEKAHVLFGAAIDATMKNSLSITLISSLPEDLLSSEKSLSLNEPVFEPSIGFGIEHHDADNEIEFKTQEVSDSFVEVILAEELTNQPFTTVEPVQLNEAPAEPEHFFTESFTSHIQEGDFSNVVEKEMISEEKNVPTLATKNEIVSEKSHLKLGQKDLFTESDTRGKFNDQEPNMVDGEDLDLPPFLRKKKH